MRWTKILGVTGTAFFSTLGGLITLQGLTQSIPLDLLFYAACVVSGIQGGLAFFREITRECDDENKNKKILSKMVRCDDLRSVGDKCRGILDNMLIC